MTVALERPQDTSAERRLRPPRWLVAIVVGVLLVSFLDDVRLLLLEGDLTEVETWNRAAGPALIMVILVVGLVRPTWTVVPAGVLLITALVSGRVVDGIIGAAIALFLVAANGARRLVLAFSALVAMWLVAIQSLPSMGWDLLWLLVPVFLAAAGAGLLIDEFQLRHTRQMAQLAGAARAAREEERRMLARELHDVVAHELTIITMQSSVLRVAASEAQREEARSAIERTSRQALDELKRLLQVMQTEQLASESTTVLPDDDLSSLIGHLAGELRRFGHGADVDVGIDAAVSQSTRTAAGRLLREAVTNALKHAGRGAGVTLTARTGGGLLRLEVVNAIGRGAGHKPVSSTGLGLAGLEERIRLLGGTFTAGPEGPPDVPSWAIRASIPLSASSTSDERAGHERRGSPATRGELRAWGHLSEGDEREGTTRPRGQETP